MTTLREAATEALDYIRSTADYKMGHPPACEAALALADALAEADEAKHHRPVSPELEREINEALGLQPKPVAWAMPRKDGVYIDVITPEEHARMPGQYTVPLYAQPKAEPQEPAPSTTLHGWGAVPRETGGPVLVPAALEIAAPQPKAEPQEPVCEVGSFNAHVVWLQAVPPAGTKLYAAPQPRKRLSNREIADLWSWSMTAEAERTANTQQHAFARAVEDAIWGSKE